MRNSLPSVLLIEPASQEKRRHLSDAVRAPRRSIRPARALVVERLKEIRSYSAAHAGELVSALTDRMRSYPKAVCSFARDAGEAVEIIRGIAGDRAIAVNKAAVIDNELRAGLISSGAVVIDSYEASAAGRLDGAAGRREAFGAMTFESRFESFGTPRDLGGARITATIEGSTKDFVGLLGISAISAEDGSVVMLQHTSNIGVLFGKAADVILVAGLDKIVRNLGDASFQTRCTAVFGAEALPLAGAASNGERDGFEKILAGMPPGKAARRIRLILLDNGRIDLIGSEFRDLFLCIGCRACDASCPACRSGKPLSPRDIASNLKKYLRQVGPGLLDGEAEPFPDGSAEAPAGGRIGEDAVWACTTCGACLEVCPLGLRHTDAIIALRRNLAMIATSSRSARAIRGPIRSVELKGHPWAGIHLQREEWTEGRDEAILARRSSPIDLLYWVGCTASLDERGRRAARATAFLMKRAGVRFAVLGEEERCCGEPLRQLGSEHLFEIQVERNIRTLEGCRVSRIVTSCPHCYNTIKKEYPRFGARFEVFHHTELFDGLLKEGRLQARAGAEKGGRVLTYHDPCTLGRQNSLYDPPRYVLQAFAGKIREMRENREKSFCCGGGGGRMWLEEHIGQRMSEMRVEEASRTGASTIATACPFCLQMFADAIKAKGATLEAMDVAELLEEALSG